MVCHAICGCKIFPIQHQLDSPIIQNSIMVSFNDFFIHCCLCTNRKSIVWTHLNSADHILANCDSKILNSIHLRTVPKVIPLKFYGKYCDDSGQSINAFLTIIGKFTGRHVHLSRFELVAVCTHYHYCLATGTQWYLLELPDQLTNPYKYKLKFWGSISLMG